MTTGIARRSLLKGAGILGLGAMAGLQPASRSALADEAGTPGAGTRPNVVLFYIDDLGYGDLGSYGSLISTPVLDGMADRGIRLTDFYAGSPVCSPSRAALLTGGYGPRVNVPNVLYIISPDGLNPNEKTLAEYLMDAGYATGMFGKWHLGNPAINAQYHPDNHGFDRWYGIPSSNDQDPVVLYDDHLIVDAYPHRSTQKPLTRMLTEKAVEWIRTNANRPFFAYIPHPQPHEPLESEFEGRSRAGAHGDSVEEIDHYIGVVLDELDALGIRDNTLVIFTSDNGPWYVGSPGDLYGRKAETYEGGMRVPFIAEWPAAIPPGQVYQGPAVNVDLLPTLAAAAGIELDPTIIIDGANILPALTQPGTTVDRGDVFYYDGTILNAVRRRDWKLHRRRVSGPYHSARGYSATEETPQLFNLALDPSESYDLSTRHPNMVDELLARMDEFDAALKADAAQRADTPVSPLIATP